MIGLYLQMAKEFKEYEVYLFCAGKQGRELAERFAAQGLEISGFADNNRSVQGAQIVGLRVYPPEYVIGKAREGTNVMIIVTSLNPAIFEPVSDQLRQGGLREGKEFLLWSKCMNLPIPELPATILEIYAAQTPDCSAAGGQIQCAVQHELGMGRYDNIYHDLENIYRQYVFPDLGRTTDRTTLDLLFGLIGTSDAEAIYIRYYLDQALRLPGDLCEFGVAQGATSVLLAHEIRDTGKDLWLFDSFEGLPVPSEKDTLKDDIFSLGSMEAYAHTMKCGEHEVRDRLGKQGIPESRFHIVRGFIEDSLKTQKSPETVCFAYVDFDLYGPIKTALHFLDTALAPGGYVVVDDYDFFSTGAKTAVDEFLSSGAPFDFIKPVEASGHFCVLRKR